MRKLSYILVFALSTIINSNLFSQGVQTFTSSGVFTVPAGITSLTIEIVGAGGTGGSNGGGGGGGGGYAQGTYAVTPLSVLSVTVGAGGSGTGTSVGSLISATAGVNGVSVANPNVGGGGAGGIGTNGTLFNRTGGNGGGGYWTYYGGGGGGAAGSSSNGSNGGNTIVYIASCLETGGTAGAGGGAPGGAGGKGAGFNNGICNAANANLSATGSNYGGGGGGGNGDGGPASNGAGGYCIINWIETVGLTENINSKLFSIFPNPASDNITLSINIKTNTDLILNIYNSIGELIISEKLKLNQQQINVKGLSNGVYLLSIKSVDFTGNQKLIIQRQ